MDNIYMSLKTTKFSTLKNFMGNTDKKFIYSFNFDFTYIVENLRWFQIKKQVIIFSYKLF